MKRFTTKNTKNKVQIARHIARMPFYQTHYTVKSVLADLQNGVIPQEHINNAVEMINTEIEKWGYAL